MRNERPFLATRRWFLSGAAAFSMTAAAGSAYAVTLSGTLPWAPSAAIPPAPVRLGDWLFFTPAEGKMVESIVDRLIPADDLSMGGREAGCAVYLDRQLAGDYGKSTRLYTKGPFLKGLVTQGYQGEATPNRQYQLGLSAIADYLRENGRKAFYELTPAEQDSFLHELEAGHIPLKSGVDGKAFFGLILNGTMEGFFADPVYGGNKDMVSWKMLGFPGARYDYRDHVTKHNQPYPHPPVSIMGSAEWASK